MCSLVSPYDNILARFRKSKTAFIYSAYPCVLYVIFAYCELTAFVLKNGREVCICRKAGHGEGVIVRYFLAVLYDLCKSVFALVLADLNGNYTAEINKKLEESNAISERVPESLFVQQYGISVKATKDDLWAFMKTISEKNKAIRIDSISIADTNFGYDPETGKLATGAETMKNKNGENAGKDSGISQATIVLNLYSVYELDEPVLE